MFDMCDNIRFDSSRVVHLAERLIDVLLIIRSSEQAARTMGEIEEIRRDVLSTFIKDEAMKNEKYKEFIDKLERKDGSQSTFDYNIDLMNANKKDEDKIDKVAHRKQRIQIETFFIKVFNDLIVVENAQSFNLKILHGGLKGDVLLTFSNGKNSSEDFFIRFQQKDMDVPAIKYWIFDEN